MEEIWTRLLPEGMDKWDFIVYMIYFLAGVFIYSFFDVRGSIRHNHATPKKFRWGLLIKDNILRWFAVLIIVVVMIFHYEEIFNMPLTKLNALLLGVNIDVVVGKITTEGKEGIPAVRRYRQKLLDKYNNV